MKKALAILMIFALVASVAVAEISISGWGRAVVDLTKNSGADKEDNSSNVGVSWSSDLPRVGFTVAGNSDNVGFQVDVTGENMGLGDQAKIWVKPVDMLTVSAGRVYDDTLRGNAAFGSFNWDRAYGGGGYESEDIIFTRVRTDRADGADGQGIVFAVSPMEAFYAVFSINDMMGKTEDIADSMQIAAGYTIDGIGQIRAQYFTVPEVAPDSEIEGDGTFEVAFKVTAVENLFLDVGFGMATNTDYSEFTKIALYANYTMDAIVLHLAGVYRMDADENAMYVGGGVDYSMDGGIGISADVRYYNAYMASEDPDGDAKITFFAGVTKGFSNGKIGAGVEVANAKNTGWAIPVILEYWF